MNLKEELETLGWTESNNVNDYGWVWFHKQTGRTLRFNGNEFSITRQKNGIDFDAYITVKEIDLFYDMFINGKV